MAKTPGQNDPGRILAELQKRVQRLELRGRGFTVPTVESVTTFAQDTEPTGDILEGSLWIDTSSSNTIKRYVGGAWVSALDPNIDRIRDEASVDIASAQDAAAKADNIVTLYYQTSSPVLHSVGDLWVHSTTKNLSRWDGSSWVSQATTTLGNSISRAENLNSLADNRVVTWWQFTEPVPFGVGDLWVDTSKPEQPLYRWAVTHWQRVLDWSLETLGTAVVAAQNTANSKIQTFFAATPPTSGMSYGDLYFNTTTKQAYRYTAGTPDAWVSVQDAAIQTALNTASLASTAADGKITAYYDLAANPPWPDGSTTHDSDIGDLWYLTDQGNLAKYWDGSMWIPLPAGSQAIDTNAIGGDHIDETPGSYSGTNITDVALTGAVFQTDPDPSSGLHIDTDGLRVYAPTGGSPFLDVSPAAGMAVVAGLIKTTSLTVQPAVGDKTTLGGTTEITTGGKLKLTGGVTAPASAPNVSSSYETLQFTNDGLWGVRGGWAFDGTYYYTARPSGGYIIAEKWNTSGVRVNYSSMWQAIVDRAFGVAIVGTTGYAFYQGGDNYVVYSFNLSTLAFGSWFFWTDWDGDRDPGIGADPATNQLLIAQSQESTGTVGVRRYSTIGSMQGYVNSNLGFTGAVKAILYGTFDIGANRYIYANGGAGAFKSMNTSGTDQVAEGWPSAMSGKVGAHWDATAGVFRSMDTTGLMRTYTGLTSTIDENQTKWVSNTLAQGSGPTYQTDQSPRTSFVLPKRARLQVTTSAIVSDGTASAPDRVRIFIGQNESFTITTKVLTSNVVTLTIGTHRIAVGNTITVAGASSPYDGVYAVTATTATTISYAKTNANVGSSTGANLGTVTRTTDPGRTMMALQTGPATGNTSKTYNTTLTLPPGTNPPAASNFPGGAGTLLVDKLDQTIIDSDGKHTSGAVGTGTFRDSVITATLHPEWGVLVSRATDFTGIVSGTDTLITWDSEDSDPSNIHSSGLYTIPAGGGGVWRFTASIVWLSDQNNRRTLFMNKNSTTSTTNILGQVTDNAVIGGPTRQQFHWIGVVAAGDVLRFWGFQNSGSALNLQSAGPTWASLEWVRP